MAIPGCWISLLQPESKEFNAKIKSEDEGKKEGRGLSLSSVLSLGRGEEEYKYDRSAGAEITK